jgi:hypothetical protein
MEEVIAIAIGVLAASGVWLILRPRTFQVVMGLCLLSYGVNLFIFSMGSLFIGKEPIIKEGIPHDLLNYTDPLPQAPTMSMAGSLTNDAVEPFDPNEPTDRRAYSVAAADRRPDVDTGGKASTTQSTDQPAVDRTWAGNIDLLVHLGTERRHHRFNRRLLAG